MPSFERFDFEKWAAWYTKLPKIFQTQKFTVRAEDIETGPNRTFPRLFPEGSGMRRFFVAPDLSHRSGCTKISPGQGFSAFYWYDEYILARIIHVFEGKARLWR